MVSDETCMIECSDFEVIN